MCEYLRVIVAEICCRFRRAVCVSFALSLRALVPDYIGRAEVIYRRRSPRRPPARPPSRYQTTRRRPHLCCAVRSSWVSLDRPFGTALLDIPAGPSPLPTCGTSPSPAAVAVPYGGAGACFGCQYGEKSCRNKVRRPWLASQKCTR